MKVIIHDLFKVITYGDITPGEIATFKLMAQRNALNDGFTRSEVFILDTVNEETILNALEQSIVSSNSIPIEKQEVSIYFSWRDTDKIKSAKHDKRKAAGFWR